MLNSFKILSPGQIEIDGTRIFLDHGDNDSKFRNKNRSDEFYMAKHITYLRSYDEIDEAADFTILNRLNILEIGIFCGGSAIFLDKKYKPKKLVCVDFMQTPASALEKYKENNRDRSISTYYGTDQADKEKLKAIIESEFDGPIDLIIDDASHFYSPSRASFEACFPYLRTGGVFALEDWSWAHNPGAENPNHHWAKEPALTNLVIRLVMANGANPAMIQRLGFSIGLMWAQRGPAQLPTTGFTLDGTENPRGKTIPIF